MGYGRSLPAHGHARGRATLTSTTWIGSDELGLAQWLDYGRRLGQLGRGVAWWLGDWLVYGSAKYGEKYTRAARVTGYDVQSLMNMSYVATRFASERRREALSWSHHAELAALPVAEQERWLDLAETERLSVHSLRLELRAARQTSRPDAQAIASNVSAGSHEASDQLQPLAVCPNCHQVIHQVINEMRQTATG